MHTGLNVDSWSRLMFSGGSFSFKMVMNDTESEGNTSQMSEFWCQYTNEKTLCDGFLFLLLIPNFASPDLRTY